MSPTRRMVALLIAVAAALAAYDGTTLALREQARADHGVVTAGIVIGRLSSTGADGSPRIRAARSRRSRLFSATDGFSIHDQLARLILTGSTDAWVIDYRYGCARAQGCRGRDFVTEELWRQLSVGQSVNVKRSRDEASSSRLDANPQWGVAIVNIVFAAALLVVAGIISGRLTTPRRRRYLTAPAVVTAVETVMYRDVKRWRVRFAYLDPKGEAQESSDEVVTNVWKPGDECIAVFPPEQPDLASFRPLAAALPPQSAAAR